jgi:hypothetical protein
LANQVQAAKAMVRAVATPQARALDNLNPPTKTANVSLVEAWVTPVTISTRKTRQTLETTQLLKTVETAMVRAVATPQARALDNLNHQTKTLNVFLERMQ